MFKEHFTLTLKASVKLFKIIFNNKIKRIIMQLNSTDE